MVIVDISDRTLFVFAVRCTDPDEISASGGWQIDGQSKCKSENYCMQLAIGRKLTVENIYRCIRCRISLMNSFQCKAIRAMLSNQLLTDCTRDTR